MWIQLLHSIMKHILQSIPRIRSVSVGKDFVGPMFSSFDSSCMFVSVSIWPPLYVAVDWFVLLYIELVDRFR
jgi:hypothetical protein